MCEDGGGHTEEGWCCRCGVTYTAESVSGNGVGWCRTYTEKEEHYTESGRIYMGWSLNS